MKDSSKKNPVDIYLNLVILTILLVWSFYIVQPFVTIIVWSIIVAVSLYPIYQKLIKLTKGKKKGLVTSLFIIVLLALILTPTINLTSSLVDSGKELVEGFEAGTLKVPPPKADVKEWPFVGEKLYGAWTKASQDLEKFIVTYKDELESSLNWFVGSFTGLIGSVALALFSLIFAGVFMMNADSGFKSGVQFINRLREGKGEEFMNMCTSTIRSVVKGILLVAIIQAVLAYIGFILIDLPAASIFAILVLIFAIIQLPPLIAMIPAIAIVFSYADSTPAIIFTVYSIIVAMSDSFLKPILLGKGLETPMLVILIGALGGMILQGLLGLFIGPVVLAIVYNLYNYWVTNGEVKTVQSNSSEAGSSGT